MRDQDERHDPGHPGDEGKHRVGGNAGAAGNPADSPITTDALAAAVNAPAPQAADDPADRAADDRAGESADDSANDAGPTEWVGRSEPVGVGPWPGPWPTDERYDPELLAHGDRRNVVDPYRYWRREAVVADLDLRRHPFHVAIENFQHDHNIGTVVRTANAFAAAAVHIVGRRRWNRRGAMVTDRYQHVHHHATMDELLEFARAEELRLVAVDNTADSVRLERTSLPRKAILLFGQEGPGLTPAAREAAELVVSIAQFGSTRSINAGVAAGVVMHSWIREHADISAAW